MPLWREGHSKNMRFGPFFGSSDVEKLHTTVARSSFPSQNAKNMESRAIVLEG